MGGELKKLEKNWLPTAERFVVFIDLLGFKDLVLRNSHEKVYSIMSELSNLKEDLQEITGGNENLDPKYHDKELYTTSFSDSIIIFSKDDSPESLNIISVTAAVLIAEAIEKQIPMKGAIAHGLISVNKGKQIYFGQPIIDAYLIQEELSYFGIVAHNSIDHYLQNNRIDPLILSHFKDIKTPFKYGSITHNNINWFESISSDTKKRKIIFYSYMNGLKKSTSGLPRRYVDNTIEVFDNIYRKKIRNKTQL